MLIDYDARISSDRRPLVLCRDDGQRVEMHLLRDEAECFALFAFAGDGERPQRQQQQGPYHSPEQALGARRAIATALLRQGYRPVPDEPAIWALAAQRAVRALREEHRRYWVSYRFDPKDVYLDW